ncbi:MAG: SAM-dependent methyltransferase [Nanoarchaeota archaeon]
MIPVSRAYEKLKFALEKFNINLTDKVCADFGSSTGGFVQALTETKCKKIYSIETSKNRLYFVLKDDPRVIVLDKTNAVHITLPEKMDFISIDVGWTKQKLIIPNAIKNLKPNGKIISLIKPHYEVGHHRRTPKYFQKKCLLRARNLEKTTDKELKKILEQVKKEIKDYVKIIKIIESPITGKKAKNREFLMLCEKR